MCPKTEGHPYGAIADLMDTLEAVFSIRLFDYLEYIVPDDFEDRHFWKVAKLKKQKELLHRLEQIEDYKTIVMNALTIYKKPELVALLSAKKLSITKEDIEYQAVWIRRWISDLRKGFFIGYTL